MDLDGASAESSLESFSEELFTNPHHLEYALIFAITIVLELELLNQYSSQILKLGQA